MKQKNVSQLALQLSFWIVMITYISSYFYIVDGAKKITWITKFATHTIYVAIHCNSIPTLLKQLIFEYYATPLQL
jgi:hypothetical protein